VNQPDLIPDLHVPANGSRRRDHARLILPRILEKAALEHRPSEEDETRLHRIILKWADLESSGRLAARSESQLEGEFLTEVFGEVLGYRLFSENLDSWDLWPKFSVPDGIADAAIGRFRHGGTSSPSALVELKGPTVNIDRDRFSGRTAVQQCWDYLNARPDCPWGIVCNYAGFRLYHRAKTPRAYEHVTLQELRALSVFRQFRLLFGRDGLLPVMATQRPLLDRLLDETDHKQREVGQELYSYYRDERRELVAALLAPPHRKPLDAAIRIAQKLVDRIIFVAFCEDRELMPERSLEKAHAAVPPFSKATNPRWQNFRDLFRSMDAGNETSNIPAFDGGLFAQDAEVDDLDLSDDHTKFFKGIGEYDFRDEVNVEVLGHLFENSINDLERLRVAGLFGERAADQTPGPRMEKSAERKRGGIYYTPREFTEVIVRRTIGEVARQRLLDVARRHGVDPDAAAIAEADPALARYWQDCFQALRRVKVCDPACGSGAFLIRAYDVLLEAYEEVVRNWEYHDPAAAQAAGEDVPDLILQDNLYGVDLSHEAVEITQLALWIRSARPGRTLANLSRNIRRGNSLVDDPAVAPLAVQWRRDFAEVFERGEAGFDCVIGNPPWERLKLQEREFFDLSAPDIASAVSAARRRELIEALRQADPELYARYEAAKAAAEQTLAHVRACGRFPRTAKGDINTYALFAELADGLVAAEGRVGLLVPSGIATDLTTREFFADLMASGRLHALLDFENKAPVFPDVHRSFKFCVLTFGGQSVRANAADFVFFAHRIEDLDDPARHIALGAADLALLNPNSRTCPIFRSRRDADLTRAVYRRVPVLIDRSREAGGNPWGVRFVTLFHQTNDAELFRTAAELKAKGFRRAGPVWKKGRTTCLPLYEAKMVQAYDHRAASVVVDEANWMRQGQTQATTAVEHQNPEFCAVPRWWVDETAVAERLGTRPRGALLCYKDVTSATNQRTMIAAFVPYCGVMNSAPLIMTGDAIDARAACCLLANVNSLAFDYVARQKVGGLHLNFFIVEQLPTLAPDAYKDKCPWDARQTLLKWVSDRVLHLTCTADDMKPLARAAGLDPEVCKWKPAQRETWMAELDAAYFLLYGIERDDAAYILSTFQGADDVADGLLDGLSTAQRILAEYDRLSDRARR
jgi:hypothetical protein